MKMRRLLSLVAVLATLFASSLSAFAEEKGSGVGSELGSGTIGGSVDSSGGGGQAASTHECSGWWHGIFRRLGFHRHH